MKSAKFLGLLFFSFFLVVSLTNCSSAQKLKGEAPTEIGQVYFQKWSSGVKGGGTGLNLYIPLSSDSIQLDSVHFRGKISKLEAKPSSPKLFIAKFNTNSNQSNVLILSSEPLEESKNKLPETYSITPFDLNSDECVISYTQDNKREYYKIKGLIEKPQINYPSATKNKK